MCEVHTHFKANIDGRYDKEQRDDIAILCGFDDLDDAENTIDKMIQ